MFCSIFHAVPNHTRSEATGFVRPRDSGILLNVPRRGWYSIYISMGIKISIDLTRATVISSGDVTSVTDELGSRPRDQSTSSVTKRANGHWYAVFRIWLPQLAARV